VIFLIFERNFFLHIHFFEDGFGALYIKYQKDIKDAKFHPS